jgi:predicted DNA-binding protein with PD1-like motif
MEVKQQSGGISPKTLEMISLTGILATHESGLQKHLHKLFSTIL